MNYHNIESAGDLPGVMSCLWVVSGGHNERYATSVRSLLTHGPSQRATLLMSVEAEWDDRSKHRIGALAFLRALLDHEYGGQSRPVTRCSPSALPPLTHQR